MRIPVHLFGPRMGLGAFAIAALALVALAMALIDRPVARALADIPEGLRLAAAALTRAGEAEIVLTAAGLAALALAAMALAARLAGRWRRLAPWLALRAEHLAFAFAAVFVPWLATHWLKDLFGRPRPSLYLSDGITGFAWLEGGGWRWESLPSGHATVAAAAALALWLLSRRAGGAFALAGAAVAATRVVLGLHYVSDVVAGAALGLLGASLVHAAWARARPGRLPGT